MGFLEKVKISIVNFWLRISKDLPHSKDRKFYLLFWFCFCAAALAYFIYVATKCAQAYKTPGASFSVDPNQPQFPIFALCVEGTYLNTEQSNFTAIAYYNYIFRQGASVVPPKLNGISFNYTSPDESSNFCTDGCLCLQFNSPVNPKSEIIYNNTGKVTIFANVAYSKEAPRSVFYLFVRSQAYGAFSEFHTDDHFDLLNIPTGSYVDASWTVSNHTKITSWVPPQTSTDVSYAMVQQLESLTSTAAQSALQALAPSTTGCITTGAPCQDPTTKYKGVCLVSNYSGFDYFGFGCAFQCTEDPNNNIPISWRCDSYEDCNSTDASDEAGCAHFTCTNGQNVSALVECDGVSNCNDGSDETNCPFIPMIGSATLYPYTKDVSVITETVTYTWDVAFAAFKSVCELGLGVLAFLFPLYFIQKSEPRRFILSPGKNDSDQTVEMQPLSEEKFPKSKASLASPQASPEVPSSRRSLQAETATEVSE